MGCDIHIVLEQKYKGNWVGMKCSTAENRYYDRFAKMAGVRGEGPDAKGLPEDSSLLSQMLSFEGFHNHSWLSLKQAIKCYNHDGEVSDDTVLSQYFDLYIDPSVYKNYRIVFWFDS